MKTKNKEIQAAYVAAYDLNGILRGKRIPTNQIDKALAGGIRMPLSILGTDIWGNDAIFDVSGGGDEDGLAEVTSRGMFQLGWTKKNTVMLPVWLANEDGSPYLGDSRRVLAEVVKRFEALELRPVMATELEFYLTEFKKNSPPKSPRSPKSGRRLSKNDVLSIQELHDFEDLFDEIYRECEKLDLPADATISENGCGQFEVNLLHTDNPLKAADDAVLFKQIVKGVAKKHGLTATFMAKPYGNQSGSGFHIHCSVLDKQGNNIFNNGTEEGTEALKHAVAGLLETMADCMLIFAPHMNSYRRLAPGMLSPTSITWGYENRTTAVRIPGGPHDAKRIEHRVAGADANPYLVCAAVLGGMIYGIEKQLKPKPPIDNNVYDQEVELLPNSWLAAIEAFEQSKHLEHFLPKQICDTIKIVKRQEANRFNQEVSSFEYSTYLEDL